MPASVSVIIAAFRAEETVPRAIRSALAQQETAEVIVVDDASDDETVNLVEAEARLDDRVRLIRHTVNQGPAAARNRALDVATSDFVAVLDSDDVFLPGRLGLLLSCADSEMVADNIAFVTADNLDAAVTADWASVNKMFKPLDAAEFVRGNMRRRGVSRGELGFLKPIMSRAFLEKHNLRYDPSLRLGEDYDLYVRILLSGGRMHLTHKPGYAAVVRATSLSARHGAAELATLQHALEAHLAMGPHAQDLERSMHLHLAEVRHKHDHRAFLDLRRQKGMPAAIRYLFKSRDSVVPVTLQIARDKLGLGANAADAAPDSGARLLLPETR